MDRVDELGLGGDIGIELGLGGLGIQGKSQVQEGLGVTGLGLGLGQGLGGGHDQVRDMIELEYIVSTKCDVYNIIIQLYTIQLYCIVIRNV